MTDLSRVPTSKAVSMTSKSFDTGVPNTSVYVTSSTSISDSVICQSQAKTGGVVLQPRRRYCGSIADRSAQDGMTYDEEIHQVCSRLRRAMEIVTVMPHLESVQAVHVMAYGNIDVDKKKAWRYPSWEEYIPRVIAPLLVSICRPRYWCQGDNAA